MSAGSPHIRPKRPVRLVKPEPNPRPQAPTFDRDVARQAWRQFARNRGAGRSLGASPENRSWLGAVIIGATLGVVLWTVIDRRPPGSVQSEPLAESPSMSAVSPPVVTKPRETRRPRSSSGFTAEAAQRSRQFAARPRRVAAEGITRPEVRRRAVELEQDKPRKPMTLTVTPTPTQNEKPAGVVALEQVPRAKSDRPPLGGVAGSGLHVDRIGVGSAYDRGICDERPEGDAFSVREHGQAHVCFRAVHLRREERVTVRWERDGRLVKRTRVRIPAMHAYRTRAGIGLRKAFIGHWDVRVMSEDGVELAHDAFDVVN